MGCGLWVVVNCGLWVVGCGVVGCGVVGLVGVKQLSHDTGVNLTVAVTRKPFVLNLCQVGSCLRYSKSAPVLTHIHSLLS